MMYTSQMIIVLLAAVPVSLSAPTANGFTIQQEHTGRYRLRSGPKAFQDMYLKYNKPVPGELKAAALAAEQGSVSASPETYDKEYLSPVSIGTPGQTLMLDFDTGSADLWVFSTEQPSSQSTGHATFNPGSSSSATQMTGETWKISYGDGSGASGNVYADKVVIGGVTATSQAVECATSVSSSFQSDKQNDGLVGLAFSSINTASPNKVSTFFDTVKSSLSQPIFASYLRKGEAGSYDFGQLDSSKYTGEITYVPVDSSRGFWEFSADGYSVGSNKVSQKLDAIADTGTSLILLPADVVRSYYSQVSGARNGLFAGGYIFPCSATLPDFGITIGGVSYTVPGSYMNYAPYSGSSCFGGLQSSSGIGINILGDVFLKAVYAVFDGGSNRIGFAPQA